MFGLSTGEIVVIALIVGLVFGWSWLPRFGERVGDLFSGVKKGLREDDERIVVKPGKKDDGDEPPKT